MPHPLLQHQRFQHDCYVRDTREGTSHQKMGQGVVLVTEPHAELNAGFVGLFASGHSAIFNWAQWMTEGEFEARCAQTADFLTSAYWKLVSQYLCRRLFPQELTPDASKAWGLHSWIQTGLALSPLFGTVAQHSIDVIIAWALIGEWSSRVLFPPPDGQWQRHGHPQCIGDFYVQRAPSLTAASSKGRLRPSSICLALCPYLPCLGIECSKAQVSTPMSNDQLSSTHMEERKFIWSLLFKHYDCKDGSLWPRRWWEQSKDHPCG